MVKRAATALGATGLAIVLAAAPVAAHECFNVSRSERANEVIAQHAHGWVDIQSSSFIGIFVVSCFQDPESDCGPRPPTLTDADVAYLQTTSFDQLIGELLGFAPRSTAIDHVLLFTDEVTAIAHECGMPTHFLTLANAAAAGGAPNKVVTNGKGIDHFPDVWGEVIGAAFMELLGGPPADC